MTLTVVMSGPRSSEQQARTALAARGFAVQSSESNHGLPDHPQGKTVKQPVSFLTVIAPEEDLDAVHGCVAPLRYVGRLHHETPPEPESEGQDLVATLADMQRRIAELERKEG